jgi:hypothetical protein
LLLLLLPLLLQLPGCGKGLANESSYAKRFSFCKEHLVVGRILYGGIVCRCVIKLLISCYTMFYNSCCYEFQGSVIGVVFS